MSILTRWLLIPPVNARLFLVDPGLDFYSAGAPALAAYSRRT